MSSSHLTDRYGPHRSLLILLVTLVVLLPGGLASAGDGAATDRTDPISFGPELPERTDTFTEERTHYLLMDDHIPRSLTDGIEVVDEYEDFLHITVDRDISAIPGALDIDIRPLEGMDEIHLGPVTIPTEGEGQEIPLDLRDDASDILILQFRGPVKEQWLEEVSRHGTLLDILGGYAYIFRVDPGEEQELRDLDFVSWSGVYHPFYKVRQGFEDLPDNSRTKANMVFFKDDPEAYGRGLGAVLGHGGRILLRDDETEWWNAARVEIPIDAVPALARLDGLNFIEPYGDPAPRLDRVRWVVQGYDPVDELTPIWDRGVNGTGVILGGADTGIDYSHVAFRDSENDTGTPGPEHRKIVQYNTSVDDWDDSSGHGSHTMGTLIGNNVSEVGGEYKFDGIAFGAKLAFYDVVLSNGNYDPPIMTDILQDAYENGARIHSDSWGDDTTAYTSRSQRIDQFQWDHPEFLTFVAPGNGGVVWEPATAKNCVSVGNSYNGNSRDIASSSAEGPANGNMINPHVVAPGMSIISPRADQNRTNSNYEYTPLSGTSLSTPVAAGSTGLIQQYFQDGFYPSGIRTPQDGFSPSGPLKKAALLNGAWDQYGGKKGFKDVGHAPNNKQGWGKVLLDDVLHFQGDERNLWVYDGYNESEGPGLATGERDTYLIHANSSEPLEITMAWNDYPGHGLLNDLDLTVLAPGGDQYRGNFYSNGRSVPGGSADGANPTESILIEEPEDGFYIINVTAINIQSQVHQRYSLVITGGLRPANQGDVNFDQYLYGVSQQVGIRVVDSDLAGLGAVEVLVSSITEDDPETVLLTETDISGVFRGNIGMEKGSPARDGTIQVSSNDTIAVQYSEDDPPGTRTDTAIVDGRPPVISAVEVTDITNTSALLRWSTDEMASGNISYGPSPGLGLYSNDTVSSTEHEIRLEGLLSSTMYYLSISSTDPVGNTAIDDNDGDLYSFRTASYIIPASPGLAGWVREGEDFNHFSDGLMYSGYFLNKTRYGAMFFDLQSIPENADLVDARLRLYPREGYGDFPNGSTWAVDLLDRSVNDEFNGNTSSPGYHDISRSPVTHTVGEIPGEDILDSEWNTFSFPAGARSEMEELLDAGGAALRIRGPEGGGDNMFAWDSGNPSSGKSLGEDHAPQLVLTLNLIPMVSGDAPSRIEMDEDGISILDLGIVFTDDGPLNYSIIEAPDHLNATIQNGILEMVPDGDWNGRSSIGVRALDNDNLSAEHTMDIMVNAVNDPPEILSIGGYNATDGMVLDVLQDAEARWAVKVEDVDLALEGDLLFYEANLSGMSFEGTDLTYGPGNQDVGVHEARISVRDLHGARDQIDLLVDVANVNDPPTALISSPGEGHGVYEGAELELNGTGSKDPDIPHGDVLTYRWTSDLDGPLGEGEVLEVVLAPGRHSITLAVMDRDGLTSTKTVNVTVWGDLDGDGTFDPEDPDDDGDGMPDHWEDLYGLDRRDPADAGLDPDGDEATNLEEYRAITDPTDGDSHPPDTGEEEGFPGLLTFTFLFIFLGIALAVILLSRSTPGAPGGGRRGGTSARGVRRPKKVVKRQRRTKRRTKRRKRRTGTSEEE